MSGEVSTVKAAHAMTDEMDAPSRVYGGYFLFEDFGSVDGTAGCRDTGDEDFGAVFLEYFFYPAPMGNFQGGYGRANGDRIKAK